MSEKVLIISSFFSTLQSNVNFEPKDSARGITLFFKASPTYVNASSAPCSLNFFAMPHAIERSLATPIINPFLPCINFIL